MSMLNYLGGLFNGSVYNGLCKGFLVQKLQGPVIPLRPTLGILPEILGLINQGHELLVFPKMLIDAVEFLNRQ